MFLERGLHKTHTRVICVKGASLKATWHESLWEPQDNDKVMITLQLVMLECGIVPFSVMRFSGFGFDQCLLSVASTAHVTQGSKGQPEMLEGKVSRTA